MIKILVATTNPGKMKELSEMLSAAGHAEWLSLRDFPDVPEVEEDGHTFAENARKKALGYAAATGLWTLADDSGLLINALDGAPGVYSARFAADEYDQKSPDRKTIDRLNYQKALRLLDSVPDAQRTARFCCHLCLAKPGQILLETTGFVEGVINRAPVGDNGFGYDPIFYIPAAGKTAAQLDSIEKTASPTAPTPWPPCCQNSKHCSKSIPAFEKSSFVHSIRRYPDGKDRPVSGDGLHIDTAAMGQDDLFCDGQPQARSVPLLVSVIGFENDLGILDALAIVADTENHLFVRVVQFGMHGYMAGLRGHRFDGVEDQVHHRILHLVGVEGNLPKVLIQLQRQRDLPLVGLRTEDFGDGLNEPIELARLNARGSFTAELEHIHHDLLDFFEVAFEDIPALSGLIQVVVGKSVINDILAGAYGLQDVFNAVRHIQRRLPGLQYPLALAGGLFGLQRFKRHRNHRFAGIKGQLDRRSVTSTGGLLFRSAVAAEQQHRRPASDLVVV